MIKIGQLQKPIAIVYPIFFFDLKLESFMQIAIRRFCFIPSFTMPLNEDFSTLYYDVQVQDTQLKF